MSVKVKMMPNSTATMMMGTGETNAERIEHRVTAHEEGAWVREAATAYHQSATDRDIDAVEIVARHAFHAQAIALARPGGTVVVAGTRGTVAATPDRAGSVRHSACLLPESSARSVSQSCGYSACTTRMRPS